VQVVGHQPARFALDADAQFLAVGRVRQRVVAALFRAVDVHAQADVLPGLVGHHGLAIHRAQVEGCDLAALGHLALHAEHPHTTPAPGGGGAGGIHLFLGPDQNVGQLLVGSAPGGQHFVSGDLGTQHLTDGAQQAGTHDGVVLRQHLQRHVLVDDLCWQVAQVFQLVDVARVHEHAVGQGTRLVAAGLVGLVEQGTNLGVLAQHDAVEVGGQGFTAGFQQGHGRFDYGALSVVEHGFSFNVIDMATAGRDVLHGKARAKKLFLTRQRLVC